MTRIAVLAFVALLLSGPSASAQDPAAPRFDPANLEGEWVVLSEESGLDGEGSTVAGAGFSTTELGGPHGARVLVASFSVGGDPTLLRRAWEYLSDFDTIRSTFNVDFGSERELGDVPPPGCTDAKRITGEDSITDSLLDGVTLCAADPDVIVIAVTAGEVNGLTVHEASEEVVLTLAQATESTPVPA